jgi:hypothetical protein
MKIKPYLAGLKSRIQDIKKALAYLLGKFPPWLKRDITTRA